MQAFLKNMVEWSRIEINKSYQDAITDSIHRHMAELLDFSFDKCANYVEHSCKNQDDALRLSVEIRKFKENYTHAYKLGNIPPEGHPSERKWP